MLFYVVLAFWTHYSDLFWTCLNMFWIHGFGFVEEDGCLNCLKEQKWLLRQSYASHADAAGQGFHVSKLCEPEPLRARRSSGGLALWRRAIVPRQVPGPIWRKITRSSQIISSPGEIAVHKVLDCSRCTVKLEKTIASIWIYRIWMRVNGGALCRRMAILQGARLGWHPGWHPAGHADHLGDLGCHEKVPGWTQGTEKRPDDWDELGRRLTTFEVSVWPRCEWMCMANDQTPNESKWIQMKQWSSDSFDMV